MKLQSVTIKNYRSIENIKFETTQVSDGTFTYGLVGVNEARKSSILQSFALLNEHIIPTALDFKIKTCLLKLNMNIFKKKIN